MDAPHASWHPALMPNTMADVVLHEPTTHTATPSDAIPDEYRDTWEAAPAREEDDREGRGQAQVHEHDGWFPDYGTGNAARQGSKPPSASQQHKSSMSFARTVSHDVNWTDDEDPESNVAHTESGEGDDDDFFRQLCPADQTAPVPEAAPAHSDKIAVSAGADELDAEAGIEDLDAKWKELLADDDTECFLLDESADEKKEMDPAAFFGDDDEGFLEDDEAPVPAPVQPAVGATQATTAQDEFGLANGRYAPRAQPTRTASQPLPNPYLPAAPVLPARSTTAYAHPNAPPFAERPPVAYSSYPNPASVPPPAAALAYAAAPPARPQPSKEHSFVTAKGGYQSPYDLPMEVVKPKKRGSSLNKLQRATAAPSAPPSVGMPPRSVSYAQAPRSSHAVASSITPPGSSHSGLSSSSQAASKPPPRPAPQKDKFFEDLPMTAKLRPGLRHGSKSLSSPAANAPFGPPQSGQPPTPPHMAPPPTQVMLPPTHGMPPPAQPASSTTDAASLVAPERVSPYAPLQGAAWSRNPPAPSASTRFSPAPSTPQTSGGMPAVANRYSPAPPNPRPHSAGHHAPGTAHATPPALPHQPRTSSPLAHFETSSDRSRAQGPEGGPSERRSNSQYEARLHRVPSLPPTREVEEDEPAPAASSDEFGSGQLPYRPRQTPPPPPVPTAAMSNLSPPKRDTSPYSRPPPGAAAEFAPPARPQTQAPESLFGTRPASVAAPPVPRPSSAQSPTSPRSLGYMMPTITSPPATHAAPVPSTLHRPRASAHNLDVIPPTDGRENDQLQRWRGSPLISWGVGGTVATMFPKEVPRYGGLDQAVPMAVRSPGDVKIKTVKDVTPLAERLSKFPGPLKGKAKKKETVAWLTSGIEGLEQGLSASLSSHAHTSHDAKREAERLLLWKILRVLVEHDGLLEGNPDVERAVRAVLSPSAAGGATSPAYTIGASLSSTSPPLTVAQPVQADTVDSAAMEQIRQHLSNGEREKAVWAAADKRLWGHAMLIANTWSPALYRQVAQEFVKKEVNLPGRNSESLAALYEVLSGNHEDSVDELVPVHARAGLQLVAKDSPSGVSTDGMAGLDKWRETLGLILSNRSPEDARAINSLGCLLAGYGRAEAAHICFIFSRSRTVFGGLDDPQSHLVLVGSDHKRQSEQFAKEIEPLLLSEVYEYGLGLASSSSIAVACPHLAPYKFQHALALAEYGYRDKALQYCDAIANAITAQTKRSPYHHYVLEAAVDDLTKRLKLAPKEDSGSWISKPSMTKVSDSVWNRFTQFVAGDEDEHAGQRSPKDGGIESGPFARVAGGTPTISRSPSVANLEGLGAANAGVPGHPSGPAALAHGSSAFGPPPQPATQASSRYAPSAARPTGANPYEPGPAYTKPNRSSSEMARPWQEMHPNAYPAAQPPSYGYEPPALTPYEPSSREKPVETANGSTFEPPSFPSYGYEPPSYQPDSEPTQTDDSGEECGTKPKKKGIMYDDDDGISAPNPATKNKEERDRENAEMFRKIAEEEGERGPCGAREAKLAY